MITKLNDFRKTINEFNSIHDPIGYNPHKDQEDKDAAYEIQNLIKKGVDKETAIKQISIKYGIRIPYLTKKYDYLVSIKESHMDFQEPTNNIDKIVQLLKTHSMNELEEMGYSKSDISIANGISMKQNNISFKDEDERIGDDPSSKQYYDRTLHNKNDKTKLEESLNNLLKHDNKFFIDMYIRGYNLHSGGASEPDNDPEFLERMVDESRHDIQFALDEIEEFYEEMVETEKFDIIISDSDKLMSACAAHANGNPILDFVYLEKRMIKEGNSTINIPGVTTMEQLSAHIMQGVQKAMDVFTAQQKMPKITVSVKGDYLNGLSQTFTEDELGIFKHGVKHAQIQISNSSKLNIEESGMVGQIIWGTFSLKYEVLSGGSNGVPYMYTDNDDQFMYDIAANKFFTRNDFFATIPEKRVTGYNTKRVK